MPIPFIFIAFLNRLIFITKTFIGVYKLSFFRNHFSNSCCIDHAWYTAGMSADSGILLVNFVQSCFIINKLEYNRKYKEPVLFCPPLSIVNQS